MLEKGKSGILDWEKRILVLEERIDGLEKLFSSLIWKVNKKVDDTLSLEDRKKLKNKAKKLENRLAYLKELLEWEIDILKVAVLVNKKRLERDL